MKRGFTLVELIIVVVILGVLLSLGVTLYTRTFEKSRSAEARIILGHIRSAEEVYRLENPTYTKSFAELAVSVPESCLATHYFKYSVPSADATTFTAQADRCTTGGKSPAAKAGYYFTINQDGTLTAVPADYY